METAHEALEEQIEELLALESDYNLKLLRMVITFGIATGLVVLITLVLFVRTELSWSAFALIIADWFAWVIMLEFKRDVALARELESDRVRLVMQLRYRLLNLKASARMSSRKGQIAPANPPAAVPEVPAPATTERIPGSIVDENFRQVTPRQWIVEDAQLEHPALVGLSPEYPNPVAIWGLATVRELYERMVSDFEGGKLTDYAFVYGVTTGRATSGPAWVARGMTLRRFNELIRLLAEAGIVENISQGKKTRQLFIKNPVQAFLVASEKYGTE